MWLLRGEDYVCVKIEDVIEMMKLGMMNSRTDTGSYFLDY